MQIENNTSAILINGASLISKELAELSAKTKQDVDFKKASKVFYKYYTNNYKNQFNPNEAQELFNSYLLIKKLALSGYGKAFWILLVFCKSGWRIAPAINGNENTYLNFDKNIYLDFESAKPLIDDEVNEREFGVKARSWLLHNCSISDDPEVWFQTALYNCFYNYHSLNNGEFEYWLKKAALGNFPVAQISLGFHYQTLSSCSGHTISRSLAARYCKYWYEKAHKIGLSNATSRLGGLYEQGLGVEKNKDQALELYLNAAEEGDVHAMYRAGYLLHGVHNKYHESKKYLRKASVCGHPEADAQLGFHYFDMATEDYEIKNQTYFLRAYDLFEIAANKFENVDAMKMLWSFYKDGLGVTADDAKASYWLQRYQSKTNKKQFADNTNLVSPVYL